MFYYPITSMIAIYAATSINGVQRTQSYFFKRFWAQIIVKLLITSQLSLSPNLILFGHNYRILHIHKKRVPEKYYRYLSQYEQIILALARQLLQRSIQLSNKFSCLIRLYWVSAKMYIRLTDTHSPNLSTSIWRLGERFLW